VRGPDALFEAVDEAKQLVALPDAPPLAFVQPIEDARIFELLKGSAYISSARRSASWAARAFAWANRADHRADLPLSVAGETADVGLWFCGED
jgi:hypothetical protein